MCNHCRTCAINCCLSLIDNVAFRGRQHGHFLSIRTPPPPHLEPNLSQVCLFTNPPKWLHLSGYVTNGRGMICLARDGGEGGRGEGEEGSEGVGGPGVVICLAGEVCL